jgi:hypothetical protein
MSQQLPEEWFVSDRRVNAIVAWAITVVLVVLALVNVLSFLLVDAILAATAVFTAIVPPIQARTWTRTVPWPLLLLVSMPFIVGVFASNFVGVLVTGVGVAGLGMLLVATLQVTTSVRMTPRFAIAFVLLVTLAFVGFWAVGSAASAVYLGTRFLETNTELMLVFTSALLGGLLGGIIFRWYFRRQLRRTAAAESGREVNAS